MDDRQMEVLAGMLKLVEQMRGRIEALELCNDALMATLFNTVPSMLPLLSNHYEHFVDIKSDELAGNTLQAFKSHSGRTLKHLDLLIQGAKA